MVRSDSILIIPSNSHLLCFECRYFSSKLHDLNEQFILFWYFQNICVSHCVDCSLITVREKDGSSKKNLFAYPWNFYRVDSIQEHIVSCVGYFISKSIRSFFSGQFFSFIKSRLNWDYDVIFSHREYETRVRLFWWTYAWTIL